MRWPAKATVLHPRRFPDTAAAIARMFAEAHTTLAAIKAAAINASSWCESPYCPDPADDTHETAPIGEHDVMFLDADKLSREYVKVDIGLVDAAISTWICASTNTLTYCGGREPRHER